MKLFLIQLLFLIFTHQGPGIVPFRNSRIIAKYVVADWDSHNHFSYCNEEAKAFLQMGQFDCGYIINGREVFLREKIFLDSEGRLKEYWWYRSEGPLTYDLEALESDKRFKSHQGLDNLEIYLASEGIYDSGNVYKVESIFRKEKLILVEKTKEAEIAGKRFFYEFE